MGNFKFSCPHCGHKFLCEDYDVGPQVVCPTCQQVITIQKPKRDTPVKPAPVRRFEETPQNVPAPQSAPAPQRDPAPQNAPQDRTDRCPYCAEPVSTDANVCPHCTRIIFRCPGCGARETMEFHETALGRATAAGSGLFRAILGGLTWGPMGGAFGWFSGRRNTSGYFKCRRCGHVIK